jgi:hypothetical protein
LIKELAENLRPTWKRSANGNANGIDGSIE